MTKYNCRFVPTLNGKLHLGHLMMCAVNEYEAHASGGKFIVRFDNSQAEWLDKLGYQAVKAIQDSIVEDLTWMGVRVDVWDSQLEMQYEAHKLLLLRCAEAGLKVPTPVYFNPDVPEVHGMASAPYPYADYLTAEMVVMDHMEGVNWLIRGNDLLDQYGHYEFYAQHFAFNGIRHTYMPRLTQAGGGELTDLSKTAGNYKVQDYRAKGWTAEAVWNLLQRSCLVTKRRGFAVDNILANPAIGRELE